MSSTSRFVAVVLSASLAVAACNDDGATPAADGLPPVTSVPTFPIIVTAENGDVELAFVPERIVSLSDSLTEMLQAVGAGEQVVAVPNDVTAAKPAAQRQHEHHGRGQGEPEPL